MALQSEISPPLIGDPNKDTKNDGDTKSDDNESSQSTDEDVDLEEGEILDSGGEEEEEEKKDCSLKEAFDKNVLKSIEQLVNQAKTDTSPPKPLPNNTSPHSSPHKVKKRPSKYIDHDQFENTSDQESEWYSSRKRKSKFDSKPIDYRKELEAYRGTPPSSPDRKREEKKKRRSSSKKSKKKTIKRKDNKGMRVKYIKEAQLNKICKFFKEGKCAKGGDCPFSHASHSYKKKELCKFYLSGHCNKGKECYFMHGEFPCKFYHTGSECYAKDACRFSHAPLTDEMKHILADYLNIHHGDDDYDRKRRHSSPSPEPPGPPPKRTCLLGSPPRHIREAEETKRWQEEMLKQQQNHPGFKIHITPPRDMESPPPFTKPNFYQETLPSTPPQKCRKNEAPDTITNSTFSHPPSNEFPNNDDFNHDSPERYLFEGDSDYRQMGPMNVKQDPPQFGWTEMHNIDHDMPVREDMQTFSDSAQQEFDFTRDIKFDETTQFSEMESSIDCHPGSPVSQPEIKQEVEEENYKDDNKTEENTPQEPSTTLEPVTNSIVIPSHLPKKQQELFKRIQQRDRNNVLSAVTSDASNSPKSFENTDSQVKDEDVEKPEVKSESSLYSSEDDDDDDDEAVADVLKNLQKEPPPAKVETKPPTGLMELLKKINKTALERNKATSTSVSQQGLLNNLLGSLTSTSTSSEKIEIPGLNIAATESKRRTLLPDPASAIVVKKEPTVAPKDPRLKNRDPRTLSSSITCSQSLPSISQANAMTPSEIINSAFTTKTTTESSKEVPYKLRGIYTKPPNYTPYINASQSNPNLLKDPRLRKHMNLAQGKENGIDSNKEKEVKVPPLKDIPPIPKLLLKYDKTDALNINIFEPSPVPKPAIENISDCKTLKPKLFDPRMRRRDSQNSSGSNTPPHLTIVENTIVSSQKLKTAPVLESEVNDDKNWFLPSLDKSWAPPPVLEKQNWVAPNKQESESDSEDNSDPTRLEIVEDLPSSSTKLNEDTFLDTSKAPKPTPPASHLPRAIADPRMAKLHNPLDSRRSRKATSESSNQKKVELKKSSHTPPNENLLNASNPSDVLTEAETDSSKTIKTIPKKQQSSDKSSEKKKTVHRNRKSSMDYASPLNSCDDSNAKSLNFNCYNKRPRRTGSLQTNSETSTPVVSLTNLTQETTPVSDFLSDSSNHDCDNSNDVNLKDMFKTIDPTASPFC